MDSLKDYLDQIDDDVEALLTPPAKPTSLFSDLDQIRKRLKVLEALLKPIIVKHYKLNRKE